MLPLSLLNSAVGHTMIVELKSGQTYNGHLISCDSWMNVNLKEVFLGLTTRLLLLARMQQSFAK